MDLLATLSEIVTLSVDDRIRLVQAIWDSIGSESDQIELTDAQRQEVERRLADHLINPDAVVAWEQVKAQAQARSRL